MHRFRPFRVVTCANLMPFLGDFAENAASAPLFEEQFEKEKEAPPAGGALDCYVAV